MRWIVNYIKGIHIHKYGMWRTERITENGKRVTVMVKYCGVCMKCKRKRLV